MIVQFTTRATPFNSKRPSQPSPIPQPRRMITGDRSPHYS